MAMQTFTLNCYNNYQGVTLSFRYAIACKMEASPFYCEGPDDEAPTSAVSSLLVHS